MKLINLLLLLHFLVVILSCNAVQTTGTSSDIDIELIGVAIVDSRPMANATVTLSDKDDSSAVAVTRTDIHGVYRFDSVQVGHYYLVATADSLVSTVSAVSVKSGDSVLEMDTLSMKKPGAIHGYVNLNGGTGRVLIYIPGTSYAARTDGSGEFIMTGIFPDSNYTVKFESDGFTSTQISNIAVFSGDTLELSTQNLTANSIPQNVKAEYDAVANTVTLWWDRMLRDDVSGYIVVRKDDPKSTAMPIELNEYLLADTFFVDSLEDELFSQVREDSVLTVRYNILGETAQGRTGYSKAIFIDAKLVRDSSDSKGFSSFSIEEGTVLTGLSSMALEWKYRGLIEWVRLDLSTDGGITWTAISKMTKNEGKFYWGQVANVQSDDCMFRIKDVYNDSIVGYSKQFSIKRVGVELIHNGSFSNQWAGWSEQIINSDPLIDAAYSIDEGRLKASVSSCDSSSLWKIRIGQIPTVPLYKNCTYELRIRAKASTATTLWYEFSSYDERARYYGQFPIAIDTEWKEYAQKFTLTEYNPVDTTIVDDPVSSQTYFWMNFGYRPADIWVDDISITVVEP